MTATVVEIKESDGWVNLTAAAGLQPGDELNVQNIGSRAVYLQTSDTQPADLSGVDYLYSPKTNPLTPMPTATESVWGNTEGFGTTKLSVAETLVATIADPLLVTAKTVDDLLEVTQGVPTAGFKGFSIIGEEPAGPDVYAFENSGTGGIVGDFLIGAVNNANNTAGFFDIKIAVTSETITGGTDFAADEILSFRENVDVIAKIEPTNSVSFAEFERVYVSANGGAGIESTQNFIILPGETVFIQVLNFTSIIEYSFSARFGKG